MPDDDVDETTQAALKRVGTEFGPYKLLRLLGEGTYGAVYEATKQPLNKRVALKVLHDDWAHSDSVVERFVREAQAAASLRHAHIVAIDDLGYTDKTPWIAMEYLEGVSLAEHMKIARKLSVEDALEVLFPIFSAVAAIHEHGIIHRDLKPENIHLWQQSTGTIHPKLLDFGIAKVTHAPSGEALTMPTDIMGTPEYMAPEQWKSAKTVTPASDQWALAVILYKLIAGSSPFRADNAQAIMFRVTAEPIPPFASDLHISPEFSQALLKALSKDPAERYSSVRAFGCALFSFASARTQHQWRPEFSPERASAPSPSFSLTLSEPPPRITPTNTVEASSLSPSLIATAEELALVRGPQNRTQYVLAVGAVLLAAISAGALLYFNRQVPTPQHVQGMPTSPQVEATDAAQPTQIFQQEPTLDVGVSSDQSQPNTRSPSSPTAPHRPAVHPTEQAPQTPPSPLTSPNI